MWQAMPTCVLRFYQRLPWTSSMIIIVDCATARSAAKRQLKPKIRRSRSLGGRGIASYAPTPVSQGHGSRDGRIGPDTRHGTAGSASRAFRRLDAGNNRVAADSRRLAEPGQGRAARLRDRSFGWASVENRLPARPTTLFGVASVSKAITGAAIMRLVDQGQVGLEERAFRILAMKPRDPRAHQITLRQLLTHTAGYRKQPNPAQVAREFNIPVSRVREKDLVASFIKRRLAYNPGEANAYSNFGFVVLGAVIERVVGIPTGPAIHRLVFHPMEIATAYYGHGGPPPAGYGSPL